MSNPKFKNIEHLIKRAQCFIDCKIISQIATSSFWGILIAAALGFVLTLLVYCVVGAISKESIAEELKPITVESKFEKNYTKLLPYGQGQDGNLYFQIEDIEPDAKNNGREASELMSTAYLQPIKPDNMGSFDTPIIKDPQPDNTQGISIIVFRRQGEGTERSMKIELRQDLFKGILHDEIRVVVDVAIYSRKDEVFQRIRWWETDDIADSAEIFRGSIGPFSKIEFPTTTSSFISWLKARWNRVVNSYPEYNSVGKRTLQKKEVTDIVAPTLERIFSDYLNDVTKSPSVSVIRILSGGIQMTTFTIFFAAIIIVVSRWWIFVYAEQGILDPEKVLVVHHEGEPKLNVAGELKKAKIRAKLHEQRWGAKSAALSVWIGVLSSLSSGNRRTAINYIESLAGLEEDIRISRGYSLRYFIGAIPAIGFVGTVFGIGLALMGTGSVLSDFLARQQSGVGNVALNLGVAFDTTLVALVLSLILLFFSSMLDSEIERVINQGQKFCLDLLVYGELPEAIAQGLDIDEEQNDTAAEANPDADVFSFKDAYAYLVENVNFSARITALKQRSIMLYKKHGFIIGIASGILITVVLLSRI